MKVQDLVLQILAEHPELIHDNDRVAEIVQEKVPGASTSAATVSSIKSKARKAGLLASTAAPAKVDLSDLNASVTEEDLTEETDDERSARIRRRFCTLERMANKVADGNLPALIVSGPPGLGKSYTVEKVLTETYGEPRAPFITDDEMDKPDVLEGGWDLISGTITAPGLILALWAARENGVVVLDDCDDVFRDEACLNILKAVLDSSDTRRVSYRKRAHWMDEYGIPQTFEFNGSVVFCTNIDFEASIRKGNSMAPHFKALIDRSLYLSLTMRSEADFITRIRQVALEDGLLNSKGLDNEAAEEVFEYIVRNKSRFYGLSLRLVGQIADSYSLDPDTWKEDISATKMRTLR